MGIRMQGYYGRARYNMPAGDSVVALGPASEGARQCCRGAWGLARKGREWR